MDKVHVPGDTGDLVSRIVWEDRQVVVVNKRPGELSQGDKTGDVPLAESLKDLMKVRDAKPGNVFLVPVHRLDRPTSGLLVFAKTSKALSRLNESFKTREVKKWYWAVVEGNLPASEGQLTDWLVRDEKSNKSKVVAPTAPGAVEARLDYRVIAKGDRYTLVEIALHTGRHHQIRAQFAALGVSIKGDVKYGARRANRDGGISLHAAKLEFPHPVGGQVLRIMADPRVVQSDPVFALSPDLHPGPDLATVEV